MERYVRKSGHKSIAELWRNFIIFLKFFRNYIHLNSHAKTRGRNHDLLKHRELKMQVEHIIFHFFLKIIQLHNEKKRVYLDYLF